MICKQKNTSYFKSETKTILANSLYCRQVVENTLPFLYFFSVDINPLLNLTTKLLESCDISGNYSFKTIPNELFFKNDKNNQDILETC